MSELKVDCININMYGMNSYIVSCDDEAMIIDMAKLSFGYDDYKKHLPQKYSLFLLSYVKRLLKAFHFVF